MLLQINRVICSLIWFRILHSIVIAITNLMIWNIFFLTKLSFHGCRLFPLQNCPRCIQNHIWYWTDSLEKLFCNNLYFIYFEEWLQFFVKNKWKQYIRIRTKSKINFEEKKWLFSCSVYQSYWCLKIRQARQTDSQRWKQITFQKNENIRQWREKLQTAGKIYWFPLHESY